MRRIALLALILMSVMSPMVGGVAATTGDGIYQSGNTSTTTPSAGELDADLAIEAPTGDVSEDRVNETTRYTTDAAPLEIHPQNFAGEDVVDYGVSTPGGRLAYQSKFDQFEFSTNATGTFTAYWIVAETVVTENGTQAVQRRYTADIRIRSSPQTQTLSQAQLDAVNEDAQKWQEFNQSTLSPLMEYDSFYAPEPDSRQELVDKMADSYRTNHNLPGALSGNLSEILTILVLTMGGLLFLATIIAYHYLSLGSLKSRLNKRLRSEAHEGDIQRKRSELEKAKDWMTMENTDVQDIPGVSEREAEEFRNEMGIISVRDLNEAFESGGPLAADSLVAYRLHAMGAAGYRGRITKSGGEITDVAVVDPEGLTDDERDAEPVSSKSGLADDETTVVNLATMDSEFDQLFLTELEQWDCDAFREFDLEDADIDLSDISISTNGLDLETLRDELGFDDHRFDDPEQFGETLYDVLEHIRMHPSTGGDGTLHPTRQTLERLLKVNNVLADKYDLPTAEWRREAIAAALEHHDAGARVERTVNDISAGKGVAGD